MTKELLYRQGSADDLQQIKELAIQSYGQYSTVLTPENWERLNKTLNDEKFLSDLVAISTPFVCLADTTIVGMAFLIPSGNPTEIYKEDWCTIRMVGVHPDYTGLGIAKNLTRLCIEKAKDLHEKTIALHTSEFMDAARHIYESTGFTILTEIPNRFGKRYWLYTLHL